MLIGQSLDGGDSGLLRLHHPTAMRWFTIAIGSRAVSTTLSVFIMLLVASAFWCMRCLIVDIENGREFNLWRVLLGEVRPQEASIGVGQRELPRGSASVARERLMRIIR